MSKLCRALLAVLAFGILVGPVRGQSPRDGMSDLDKLLLLLGQGCVVNNERWCNSNIERIDGKTVPIWLKQFEPLKNSPTREVSQTIKLLKPAFDLVNQELDRGAKGTQLANDLRKELGEEKPDIAGAAMEIADGLDPQVMEQLVKQGRMTRAEADARLAKRNNVINSLESSLGKALVAGMLADMATRPTRYQHIHKAEVLWNEVVLEQLLPSIRARSGREQTPVPLDIKLAEFSNFQTQPWSNDVKVTIRSRSKQPLTRLTLIFEFQTTEGSRRSMIHVPTWPREAGCLVDSIALSAAFLKAPPKDTRQDLPKISRVRYSVWCDQFRAEDQEPTTISREEMVTDRRLLALQPGVVYVSEGGKMPNLSHKEFMEMKVKPQPEAGRRFELTVQKLTPSGPQDYNVELSLLDHQVAADQRKPQLYRGAITMPQVKFDGSGYMKSHEDIKFQARSDSDLLELKLMGRYDGKFDWHVSRGAPAGRRFVPDGDILRPDHPYVIARNRLRAANELAVNRKYTESIQAYEKIIAENSDSPIAEEARRAIASMDNLKKDHQELDAREKTKYEQLAKAKGMTVEEYKKFLEENQKARSEAIRQKFARDSSEQAKSESSKSEPTKSEPKRRTSERPTPSRPSQTVNTSREPRSTPKSSDDDSETVTSVTLDEIEYVYQGAVRKGDLITVTVLVTSQQGDREERLGALTLVDEDGKTWSGRPSGGIGARAKLPEGKPVKLEWQFGGKNAFGGGKLPSPQLSKGTTFSKVTLAGGFVKSVVFRNVPAVPSKSKTQ